MRKLILTTLASLTVMAYAFAQPAQWPNQNNGNSLPDLYQSSWPYVIYSTANSTTTNNAQGTFHIAFPSTNFPNLIHDILTINVSTNSSGGLYEIWTVDTAYWQTWTIGTQTNPVSIYSTNSTFLGNTTISGTYSTNSTKFSEVTTDFTTGVWYVLGNRRAIVTVTLSPTTAAGGLWYSNAVSGSIVKYLGVGTNTFTVAMQPNSQFTATNATVQPSTSDIVYQ